LVRKHFFLPFLSFLSSLVLPVDSILTNNNNTNNKRRRDTKDMAKLSECDYLLENDFDYLRNDDDWIDRLRAKSLNDYEIGQCRKLMNDLQHCSLSHINDLFAIGPLKFYFTKADFAVSHRVATSTVPPVTIPIPLPPGFNSISNIGDRSAILALSTLKNQQPLPLLSQQQQQQGSSSSNLPLYASPLVAYNTPSIPSPPPLLASSSSPGTGGPSAATGPGTASQDKFQVKAAFIATIIRFLILKEEDHQQITQERESFLVRYPFLAAEIGTSIELTWLFRFERCLRYLKK
jgi:hypothetical protein